MPRVEHYLEDYEQRMVYVDGKWVSSKTPKKPVSVTEAKEAHASSPQTPTNSSEKEATREFIQSELRILKGSIDVSEPVTKIKAKRNIYLKGLGKYLSGLYHVESVNYSFSSEGFTQTLDLVRNGVGEYIKSGETLPKELSTKSEFSNREVVANEVNLNKHTVVKGDTLWGIATKYYGNGSKWKIIANANNIQDANSLKIGVELIIPN